MAEIEVQTDSVLVELAPTFKSGLLNILQLHEATAGMRSVTIMRFNLSTLLGTTLATCVLDWVIISLPNVAPVSCKIDRLTQSYIENQVTWDNFAHGNPWPGGGGGYGDTDATNRILWDQPIVGGRFTIDILALAQDAIDAHRGDLVMHLQCLADVDDLLTIVMNSKQSPQANRPKITYTLTGTSDFSDLDKGSGYMGMSHAGLVQPPAGW